MDSVASHPMAITSEGDDCSLLEVCVRAAPAFHLEPRRAQEMIDELVAGVREHWTGAADLVHVIRSQRDALWGTSILNPAIWWAA